MKKYAIAPDNVKIADYLTNGKKYEIVKEANQNRKRRYGMSFEIINNDGIKIYCLEKDCVHIHYNNWTIVEE